MRAAKFTDSSVELGGCDAPDVDRSSPVNFSRPVLWLLLLAFLTVLVLLLAIVPRMIGGLVSVMPVAPTREASYISGPDWELDVVPDPSTPSTGIVATVGVRPGIEPWPVP